MTNKEKKEFLERFSETEGRIKELECELETLWTKVPSATPDLSGAPKGMPKAKKTEAAIERMEKLVNLIDEEKDELESIRFRIMSANRKLKNITERRIIHLKYIGKPKGLYHRTLPLWKIANELGYSHDRIKHMHGDALQHLEL